MKTWKPDTCGCEVEELYDGNMIVGMGQVIRKCVNHQNVPDAQLYDVILNKENLVKNRFWRILLGYEELKNLGLEEPKINPDGADGGLGLKSGLEYVWSFTGTDSNRVLRAEVTGVNLTKTQKDALQALCDTKFGLGKVVVI